MRKTLENTRDSRKKTSEKKAKIDEKSCKIVFVAKKEKTAARYLKDNDYRAYCWVVKYVIVKATPRLSCSDCGLNASFTDFKYFIPLTVVGFK